MKQCRGECADVFRKIYLGKTVCAVKLFVNERHRCDAVLAFAKEFQKGLVGDFEGLQVQQAGDDLQIVFDAVMNLFEKDFFLMQRGPNFLFRLLLLGDVLCRPAHEDGHIVFIFYYLAQA